MHVKIHGIVQEILSGHEIVTDGRTDNSAKINMSTHFMGAGGRHWNLPNLVNLKVTGFALMLHMNNINN